VNEIKYLKKDLEILYKLQICDIKIKNINEKINHIPNILKEVNKVLEDKKKKIDIEKNNNNKLIFLRKEKESLLALKENTIKKYLTELNVVKSNVMYKTLVIEIEKAKDDKDVIEDELIKLMDAIDKNVCLIKKKEKELLQFKEQTQKETEKIEISADLLKKEISVIKKEREIYKLMINSLVFLEYERLSTCCNGLGVSLVYKESCSVCGIMLRPQLINKIKKAHTLVFCDNCSRILLMGNTI
jgi:predicted  nucleic acid-binding Zn-ribbon protein